MRLHQLAGVLVERAARPLVEPLSLFVRVLVPLRQGGDGLPVVEGRVLGERHVGRARSRCEHDDADDRRDESRHGYPRSPIETYFVSRYASSPSWANSRPRPDSFMPPNGHCGVAGTGSFTPIMPASSPSAIRHI